MKSISMWLLGVMVLVTSASQARSPIYPPVVYPPVFPPPVVINPPVVIRPPVVINPILNLAWTELGSRPYRGNRTESFDAYSNPADFIRVRVPSTCALSVGPVYATNDNGEYVRVTGHANLNDGAYTHMIYRARDHRGYTPRLGEVHVPVKAQPFGFVGPECGIRVFVAEDYYRAYTAN